MATQIDCTKSPAAAVLNKDEACGGIFMFAGVALAMFVSLTLFLAIRLMNGRPKTPAVQACAEA